MRPLRAEHEPNYIKHAGRNEQKKTTGRTGHGWEDSIKTGLRKVGFENAG